MERSALWYLDYVAHDIHRTVVATTDDEGLPVTAAIDMMMADEGGLYFLTARGKGFYRRLIARPFLALTGMKGDDTMTSVAVSIRGRVREVGPEFLPALFERNPYMANIYPTAQSRQALTVFNLYEGTGEWFDLSTKPITRASFSFGGATATAEGYAIDRDLCTGCGTCLPVCPQQCITLHGGIAAIEQAHCLHCGRCAEVCPTGAAAMRADRPA